MIALPILSAFLLSVLIFTLFMENKKGKVRDGELWFAVVLVWIPLLSSIMYGLELMKK